MNVTVLADSSEKRIELDSERLVADILSDSGIVLPKPCAGSGSCGKCRVTVSGSLSEPSKQEREHLTPEQLRSGLRLACRARVTGDAVIDLRSVCGEIVGVTRGMVQTFAKEPLTGERECYAAAVDIGTTSVAVYFYKMPQCECVGEMCVANPQSEFGADVVSRIAYSLKGSGERLRQAITACIDRAFASSGYEISFAVITGNTAMLHLYNGLCVKPLSAYPFKCERLFGEYCGSLYFPRCVSAFVGADITCAVLASSMMNEPNSLLVDIGTNGEMVFNSKDGLVCCSTAAGPAFEGAGISCGMMAQKGAISRVYIGEGRLGYDVIGGGRAQGICGSGVIDAVACMLKLGVIGSDGYLEQSYEIGDSGVFITAQDIRCVQLAKSAIRAGIDTLCPDTAAVGEFYVAGGFGSYIDMASCAAIGMIPQPLAKKARVIGNASGNGAAMILQSRSCLDLSVKIAESAVTRELSDSSVFAEKYIENMSF